MKTIEVDNELYRYIASQTLNIGESASDILRRLLLDSPQANLHALEINTVNEAACRGIVVSKDGAKEKQMDSGSALRSLLISEEFTQQEKAIGRFMLVLSTLYRIDSLAFSEAAAFKGRTRVYFADNQEALLASGKTTKPKLISGSPFWVITNSNTGRKRQMVEQLMIKMGYSQEVIDMAIHAI